MLLIIVISLCGNPVLLQRFEVAEQTKVEWVILSEAPNGKSLLDSILKLKAAGGPVAEIEAEPRCKAS
jgi:hypothetical protein